MLADTVIDYPDMGNWWNARLISGGFHVGEKGDTLQENATTLTYQLANPIITPIPDYELFAGPNYTYIVEPGEGINPEDTTTPTSILYLPLGIQLPINIEPVDIFKPVYLDQDFILWG